MHSFPNPEGFRREWFDENYGPCEGLVTFVCHEDTPEGAQYYLAGYPITGYDEEPSVKDAMVLPVSSDILKLAPEDRDLVAAELDERIFRRLRETNCAYVPYQRISDPEIRAFAKKEDEEICREMFGDGERCADKYDEYYRKLANALLDHENPKFGIERIAASLEQAAPICHRDLHDCRNAHHDTEYVVRMLDDVLRERGASQEEQDAFAAYKKSFHARSLDYESPMDYFFCRSASQTEIDNGLTARLIRNDFPELPKDAPCYTMQVIEATKERNNHCIRQDSANGEYIPLNLTQDMVLANHVFLDGKPRGWGETTFPEYSARQAALIHCMEKPHLAEEIDWKNPQVCVTAASIAVLRNEKMPRGVVSLKNDYPALGDFSVTESGKFQSEIPLCVVNKQRFEPRSAEEKENLEKKEHWQLGDSDYHVQFSGNLEDARNMDAEALSVSRIEKPFGENSPLPEDRRFLLLNAVSGQGPDLRYAAITQNGESYAYHDLPEPVARKTDLAPEFILDYEKRTGTITLEHSSETNKEPVRCSYIPRNKINSFIKKHTAIRKGLKKDPAYKKFRKEQAEELPF